MHPVWQGLGRVRPCNVGMVMAYDWRQNQEDFFSGQQAVK